MIQVILALVFLTKLFLSSRFSALKLLSVSSSVCLILSHTNFQSEFLIHLFYILKPVFAPLYLLHVCDINSVQPPFIFYHQSQALHIIHTSRYFSHNLLQFPSAVVQVVFDLRPARLTTARLYDRLDHTSYRTYDNFCPHIYIHVYTCIYICIYMYVYTYRKSNLIYTCIYIHVYMRFDLRPLRLTTGWSEPNAVGSRTLSVFRSSILENSYAYEGTKMPMVLGIALLCPREKLCMKAFTQLCVVFLNLVSIARCTKLK